MDDSQSKQSINRLRFLGIGVLITAFSLFSVATIYAEEEKKSIAIKKMVLPPPGHVGVVVKNLDEAIAYYSETFGLGPFRTVVFAPPQHWFKGEPCPIKLKIGVCQWGAIGLELIEPVEGDGLHQQFLQEKGEGLQHLGMGVDDYDEWVAYLEGKGIDVLMNAVINAEGRKPHRAAYMQSDAIGGVLFELGEARP